jgi:hypothetical protein
MKRYLSIFFAVVVSLFIVACDSGTSSAHDTTVTPDVTRQPSINAVASPTKSTKTATPLPQPTSKPVPVEDFSFSTMKITPPEDILTEITYYAAGGGGGDSPPCPLLKTPGLYVMSENEWLHGIRLSSCGWNKGDKISLTITYPDGRIKKEILSANQDGGVVFFIRSADMPPGVYLFKLEGKKGEISGNTDLVILDTPKMYGRDTLFLSGFKPHESFRLFVYEGAILKGWKSYTTNETGQLVIDVPFLQEGYVPVYTYYIVGEHSGFVSNPVSPPSSADLDTIIVKKCGKLDSRLETDTYARVAIVDGTLTNVRKSAGFDKTVVTRIREGEKIRLLEKVCHDKHVWWKVRLPDGTIGWMVEYQKDKYLLEPLP